MEKVLVTGAGGFIGHHLVRFLKSKGYWVRGVDVEKPMFSSHHDADSFVIGDLTNITNCLNVVHGIDKVYNLAALNGSIELIETNHADLVYNNSLININMAKSCQLHGVKRIFYASSACAYPVHLQDTDNVWALREEDAYPANPDSEYGWEKLFSERHWLSYAKDHGLEVRIGRYFNIYGPEGIIDTLKSKAPMALTRKVIEAGKADGKVHVWGDGDQKRSFCHVNDCVRATWMLMESDVQGPVNIGTSNLISINNLVERIASIEKIDVEKVHQLDKVQGVRTRHGDFTRAQDELGWIEEIPLMDGLAEINKFAHTILD